ncbi:MAG TPA: bifunctional metallophosphatase/5'-nucleotidase [Alphaproteobacteria bacterium]|nr:bifunctional metallophosphatase/5'-nucleotidase [Alphaproteobacteria bacterium]
MTARPAALARLLQILMALTAIMALHFPALRQAAAETPFTLTVIHTNDVHDRVDPVSAFNNTCGAKDRAKKRCFGGYSRLMTLIHDMRKTSTNPVVLSGGDQFQGSLFYRTYKGRLAAKAMNLIGYDATAIGNHEFDDGPAVLARFIKSARFPVVATNIDAAREPGLNGLIRPFVVLRVGSRKIGIVGYTTEDTPELSKVGKRVRFTRAEDALSAAIAILKTMRVNKIIAVSHAGFRRDKRVAAAVEGIDVIVGGHTNTLLSNSARGAEGPYPVVVKSPAGKPVLVVQAFAFSRYVGKLEVRFDGSGVPVKWQGDLVPVGFEVPKHPKMEALIKAMRGPVDALRRKVVGELATGLDGSTQTCRSRECTMGNMVADALVWKTRAQGTQIAFINGGGVRASMGAGPATMGAILVVLPFQNALATLKLRGRDLRAALEHGVSQVTEGAGRFPQVSGMHFVWDPARPRGKRIVSVEVRAGQGWSPLTDDAVYKVATIDYLRGGGDGYKVFKEKAIEPYDGGVNLEDAVAEYVAAHSPLRGKRDGRIRRVGAPGR